MDQISHWGQSTLKDIALEDVHPKYVFRFAHVNGSELNLAQTTETDRSGREYHSKTACLQATLGGLARRSWPFSRGRGSCVHFERKLSCLLPTQRHSDETLFAAWQWPCISTRDRGRRRPWDLVLAYTSSRTNTPFTRSISRTTPGAVRKCRQVGVGNHRDQLVTSRTTARCQRCTTKK